MGKKIFLKIFGKKILVKILEKISRSKFSIFFLQFWNLHLMIWQNLQKGNYFSSPPLWNHCALSCLAHGELAWLFHEPHTGLEDCLRMLQSCFRKRRSACRCSSGCGRSARRRTWASWPRCSSWSCNPREPRGDYSWCPSVYLCRNSYKADSLLSGINCSMFSADNTSSAYQTARWQLLEVSFIQWWLKNRKHVCAT